MAVPPRGYHYQIENIGGENVAVPVKNRRARRETKEDKLAKERRRQKLKELKIPAGFFLFNAPAEIGGLTEIMNLKNYVGPQQWKYNNLINNTLSYYVPIEAQNQRAPNGAPVTVYKPSWEAGKKTAIGWGLNAFYFWSKKKVGKRINSLARNIPLIRY